MKMIRRLILAAVVSCMLGIVAVPAHANQNGTHQNGTCQNGIFDPTTGKCINNPDNHV